jgi:glucosylceramidase
MKRLSIPIVAAVAIATWLGANQPTARAVDVWITTGDKSQLLRQNPDVVFQPGAGSGGTVIQVVPTTTYQTMSGFGAAMTDSSAWLLQNKMSPVQRDKLMRQLFSPETGVGLNYLRVPMGASDFTASGFYTYNDSPPGGTDNGQQHFSVAHDDAYIVSRLQQARDINPALKIMASPWSAPAWMKTNNSLLGGSLAPQWEASYARYLSKFVQAYADRGLPIDAITVQNEPLHTSNYPTMFMSAAQQARLIGSYVGPQFAADGVTAKIIAYDHNWDDTAYPLAVLGDAAANQYVAGTAFHAYAGNVAAQSAVHDAFPGKDIYFTEISGGDWATNFGDNLVWYSQNIIIGGARNWAKTAILWNLVLDQNSNPHQGGCGDCRGVVTVNNATGEFTFNEEFYALGQATIAIQPNAMRIGSTTSSSLNTVAFLNPDGSRVLLAVNPNSSATTLRLYENGSHFVHAIPGKSLATFLWDDGGADFDNGGFDRGGFHQGGGSLDGWSTYGNSAGNVSAATEAIQSGEKSLKLFGQFNGSANASGAFQGMTVEPGDVVGAHLSSYVRSVDSIAGSSNSMQMRIEFYSLFGGTRDSASFLGEIAKTIADGSSPNDVWQGHDLRGVAPAGAAEARLVLEFLQPTGEPGAIHLDSVEFGLALPGDFNRDGAVDRADLEVWRQDFGRQGDASADADSDGDADGADMLLWQQNLSKGVSLAAPTSAAPECCTHTLGCIAGVAIAMAGRCHHRVAERRRPELKVD